MALGIAWGSYPAIHGFEKKISTDMSLLIVTCHTYCNTNQLYHDVATQNVSEDISSLHKDCDNADRRLPEGF